MLYTKLQDKIVLEFFIFKGVIRIDIHIKTTQKYQLAQRKIVKLSDVADVFVSQRSLQNKVEDTVIFQIPADTDNTYLISIIEVVKAVSLAFPDDTVSTYGEDDILVEYHQKAKTDPQWFIFLKVALVCIILFAGAMTTIMCFQSDGQLAKIFENYYEIFTGEQVVLPKIFTIPYSIGLGLGVIVFFNHFSKITLTDDPTPIEIEMTTYEQDTNASVIDCVSRRQSANKEKEE
ncbi:MAG: stage V sporulation protein AA [Bacillota bacterium]